MEKYKLFDAEYKFMGIIWSREPINSTELSKICLEKLGWKKSTTYNMIRKLCEKGFLKNEDAIVISLIGEDDVKRYEGKILLKKMFDNSLPEFIATFLKDKKLTQAEAKKIYKMIEEASK